MKLKPKFTPIENELMGRHRGLAAEPETKAASADDVLMPSLEDKQVVVNRRCVDEAKTLIGCLQVNKTEWPRMTEADRQAVLGETKDWRAYGDLHLAVDESKPEGTRMRSLHQVIRAGVVYLQPLMKLAADGAPEVKAAAIELCKAAGIVEENSVGRPQRGVFACPVMAMGRSCPMNNAGRCAHLSDNDVCKISSLKCPLAGPACPLMAAGEGCPMDQWQGCAQLNAEGECGLQDSYCQLVKTDEEGEGEE